MAEEAFLAGLMHDIGKLVLNQEMGEKFAEVVQVVYNENRNFAETEREILGFDHTEVGALLVNKWNLSPTLEQVIASHHNAQEFTPENPMLLYLDLANNICKRQGVGFLENRDLPLHDSLANQILAVPSEDLEEVSSLLAKTLETELEIFV
jgi:putative nucleotidyltransferase with HDIG domain